MMKINQTLQPQILEYCEERVCSNIPYFSNVHLVDLFLYDSSLFANSTIIETHAYTIIVDVGTSQSVGAIKNYLAFNEIDISDVIIIPTHHHFDHTGGILSLIRYLENKGSNVEIFATQAIKDNLTHRERHKKGAERLFGELIGDIEPIPGRYFKILNEKIPVYLHNDLIIRLLETPGHSPDHISPLFIDQFGRRICVFGEALGINLKKELYPIPATSAPEFNSDQYIQSIKKIIANRPDLGIFSHFGAIIGRNRIKEMGVQSIRSFYDLRAQIIRLYKKYNSVKRVTQNIYNLFSNFLATASINKTLAEDLAFTQVYGILMDAGFK